MAFYSFANEARDIYRRARKKVDLYVKAGLVEPNQTEQKFKEFATKDLKKFGLTIPKDWDKDKP